jgi:hypothetical protein
MIQQWKFPATLASLLLLVVACGPRAEIDTETVTAELAGENEVPAVATMASGEVSAVLTGLTLVVEGAFEGLMSDLTEIAGSSAHVHEAAAGANGGVVFVLDVASTDQRSGTLSGEFELTAAQREAFRAGDYYVNIHTEGNPSGELRAQLVDDAPMFAAAERVFDATLLPNNEVPPVLSGATGSATGLLRSDNMVTVSGAFANLETALFDVGDVGPAHVHEGFAGANGGVAFMLDVVADGAMTAGRFGASSQFTGDEVDTLLTGGFYVNIHTQGNQGGEIRGQLFPTDVETTATLSGDAEVPPVSTAASGEAMATASGFTFSLEGSFMGLESDLMDVGAVGPAHIHVAPAGENGGVAFALDVVSADERSGTLMLADTELSELERADFVAGRFYVNIHTEVNTGGELRGQFEPF